MQEDIARTKKNPAIIVGTPGRINNFIRNDHIKTKKIKMLVIDEADKLIGTESFEEDVVSIIKACPKTVQKCLFSATFPQSVEAFCTTYLNEPEMINCMTNSLTLKGITQYIANVKEEKYKVMLINVLFKTLQINQCIIFVNKYQQCEKLSYMLSNQLQIPSFYVHSRMDLEKRSQIFHDFSQRAARVLVTTDLYTRGIDIRTVNVVINFNVPNGSDDYLHRIGRCGRYGHRGLAITLICGEREKNKFLEIDQNLKLIQQKQIQILPQDLSSIPVSIYACSSKDVCM